MSFSESCSLKSKLDPLLKGFTLFKDNEFLLQQANYQTDITTADSYFKFNFSYRDYHESRDPSKNKFFILIQFNRFKKRNGFKILESNMFLTGYQIRKLRNLCKSFILELYKDKNHD